MFQHHIWKAAVFAFFFFLLNEENWKENWSFRSSHRGATEANPTRNHEIVGLMPGLAQWVKVLALLSAVV